MRAPDIALFQDYRSAVLIHKYTGSVLFVLYIFWFIVYWVSGGLKKQYLPTLADVKSMRRQVFYYAGGMFRSDANPFKPSPDHKFNPLQKAVYLFVMFFAMPLVLATGILSCDIFLFRNIINVIGGVRILHMAHVSIAYFLVIYLLTHFYMATLGKKPYSLITAMITGYHTDKSTENTTFLPGDGDGCQPEKPGDSGNGSSKKEE